VPCAEVVEVTDTGDGIRLDKVWVACDVGTIVDPVNFENLVQGGVIFGLGHAINCEITYADGMAEQANYYDAPGLRIDQCPEIVVKGLENGSRIRGIGEPPVPPAAPALANAIFAATGTRLREMPFNKFVDFVWPRGRVVRCGMRRLERPQHPNGRNRRFAPVVTEPGRCPRAVHPRRAQTVPSASARPVGRAPAGQWACGPPRVISPG